MFKADIRKKIQSEDPSIAFALSYIYALCNYARMPGIGIVMMVYQMHLNHCYICQHSIFLSNNFAPISFTLCKT